MVARPGGLALGALRTVHSTTATLPCCDSQPKTPSTDCMSSAPPFALRDPLTTALRSTSPRLCWTGGRSQQDAPQDCCSHHGRQHYLQDRIIHPISPFECELAGALSSIDQEVASNNERQRLPLHGDSTPEKRRELYQEQVYRDNAPETTSMTRVMLGELSQMRNAITVFTYSASPVELTQSDATTVKGLLFQSAIIVWQSSGRISPCPERMLNVLFPHLVLDVPVT